MTAHRGSHGDPGPNFPRPIAGLHELVVRQIEQLTEAVLAQLLEEPVIELLVDVTNPRLADEV